MLKLFAVLTTVVGMQMAASCGYDGDYRYPCQDPSNWGAWECEPPQCEAWGTCTNDLLPPSVTHLIYDDGSGS